MYWLNKGAASFNAIPHMMHEIAESKIRHVLGLLKSGINLLAKYTNP
ncbi:hypothetical protein L911_1625 [Vibrio fluvialis I21563]|jgi:hypothetical protein|nr:hypothetical protein L911_1625 [Vibrio fluvialis I21563]